MKKTGFIASLVCVLFGTTELTLTEFLSYGKYISFVFVNIIAVLLIILGIVGMFCFALIKTKD